MPSGSSQIHQYLTDKGTGFRFTTEQILAAISTITEGMVTGFLAKAKQKGAIQVLKNNGHYYIYEVIDMTMYHTRGRSSHGSNAGRHLSKFTKLPITKNEPEEETLDSILIDFANNIETSLNMCLNMFKEDLKSICDSTATRVNKFKHDIETVSEDSLLNELKRRIHERDVP